jgi:hypothetical protein
MIECKGDIIAIVFRVVALHGSIRSAVVVLLTVEGVKVSFIANNNMSSIRFAGFEILWRVLMATEGFIVLVVVSCCAVGFREVVLVELMFKTSPRSGPWDLFVSFVLDCVVE